ncbi:MAG: aminotransferase class V-fold PLP-dependent enzyme [Candidatus Omnitrophica bacterium]|nr:aminotransferase class V-fold PLP-dependent enzyme [Candidatus Omnitrophota bacterium]
MILKKVPIVATDFNIPDIFSVFRGFKAKERFEKELAASLGLKYVFTVDSGTSAFYLILKALSSTYPDKKEVVLPAYTAASLVLPIKRLGLKIVLCDISLDTFNLDIEGLNNLISKNTLCVTVVHLFGLVFDLEAFSSIIKRKGIDTIIVEDCAQALGSFINKRSVGSGSDVSLFSFNRGKNMSTASGGAIGANDDRLADLIRKEINILRGPSIFNKFMIIVKLILLSLVVRPLIYNCLYHVLKTFRSTKTPMDFSVSNYTDVQSRVGLSLLKRLHLFSKARHSNGSFLYDLLSNKQDLIIPHILNLSIPAYNRFPVIFRDIQVKKRIRTILSEAGIDSSEMYEQPLHFKFNLGYKKGDFPNAEFIAERLLTLPSHPLVNKAMLNLMRKIFDENLQ